MCDSALHAMSGAAGGILAMTVTYPLIFMSTRAAVNEGKLCSVFISSGNSNIYLDSKARQGILDILSREGVAGLYSGLTSSLLGIAVTNGVYYYFYEQTKEALRQQAKRTSLSVLESMLSSLIAGSATTIVANPIWVIQTSEAVLTMQSPSDGSSSEERPRTFLIIQDVISKHGLRGFWRGLGPALVLVINPIIQYTLFEQLKNILVRIRATKLQSRGPAIVGLSDGDIFLLGALSKLVATGATYPYIVVKSRLQAGSESVMCHKSSFSILRTILKEEGIEGLYKGIGSKLVQSILTAAILFSVQRRIFQITKNVCMAHTGR